MLVYEAEVSGAPKTLALYNNIGGYTGREVIYGTSDGKVGLIELGVDEPIPKWELANEKRLAGVSCVDSFDITNDGVMDLLVSREDGVVEVYVYDSMDNPTLKYTYVKISKKNFFLKLTFIFKKKLRMEMKVSVQFKVDASALLVSMKL